jgi:penicillin-binding protein 1A
MSEQIEVKELEQVVVRFSGDSGDGMQLAGSIFSTVSATVGNGISTFPDYPADIRAPQGSLTGVSGFQVHIGAGRVYTPGDLCDVLVAMNAAALKTQLRYAKPQATIIIDTDSFGPNDLKKAEIASDDYLQEFDRIYPAQTTSNKLRKADVLNTMQRYAEAAVREHMSKEVQPQFNRELRSRGGNPFCDIDAAQQEKILVQAMKGSDRYYQLHHNQGKSEKEIRAIFKEKVKMKVFSWKGNIDTVMSPWDSLLYYKKFLNVGLMSVEPGTGYVKAYVGGINYRYFKYDNVMSHRQVGSTFKPFVYTMALQDLGMYPCTEVPNAQVCFEQWGQPDWCPKNSTNERENQMVTLKWALAHSVNWVSAYLMKQGSPEQVISIARKMGVTSDIDAVPAICVGTPEITVYEMAGAMATFANKGEYVEPIFITRIEDSKGTVLDRFTPERHEAISERTAYMMIELMKGVVQSGTGVRLNYKYHLNDFSSAIAGKTGTTQNNSDCWFVGLTPKLATAIWTGGEVRSIHFRNMTFGQGAAQALPIFGHYMRSIYSDKALKFPRGDFDRPNVPLDVELDCAKFQQEIQEEEPYYDF